MSIADKVDAIFPDEGNIPKEFLLESQIHQVQYLIDGELRHWHGPMQEVISPVCVRTSSGAVPKLIGSCPQLTQKESVEALKAAVNAYNNGRGLWPTLSIGDRIAHIEEFTYMMAKQKEQILNLLMSVLGKRQHFDGLTVCCLNEWCSTLRLKNRNAFYREKAHGCL